MGHLLVVLQWCDIFVKIGSYSTSDFQNIAHRFKHFKNPDKFFEVQFIILISNTPVHVQVYLCHDGWGEDSGDISNTCG